MLCSSRARARKGFALSLRSPADAVGSAKRQRLVQMPVDLYRIFNTLDELLYVGISYNAAARASQHRRDQPWWHEAATIKIERLADRDAALAAEKQAIQSERPKYNIIHRIEGPPLISASPPSSCGWTYSSRRYGHKRTEDLWLYPELSCSPCIYDVWGECGEDQLDYYVSYLRKKHPEYWESDSVPIYWTVEPACETAPFTAHAQRFGTSFLDDFTWPSRTGEPLDWFTLPVRHSRFPEFGKALGWLPSPLQDFAPLKSIMTSRWRSRDAAGR